MKLAIERSKTQLHSSQPSGSGAHEGTGVTPGVPDVPKYRSDDEQLSWKSSDEEDDDDEANVGKDEDDDDHDDDDERTESDNDGEDFVHPKFSTHDDEARQEEVNEEDSFDPRVQTPSHVESTDDDNNDDEIQSANVAGEEMDEEATNAEGEENKLYRDVNVINPEGQQQSSSVSSGFVSNMLNPRPDTGIDSIFTLNTEATSLVDVPVTTIAEPPLVSATTLPPPPTPLITHMQQTPVPTPTTIPSTSLQDLPNFGSLFGFDHRLKTLETEFFEFKQTNQFAEAVSSIPSIVDVYLANKMKEVVKTVVQLQSNRLRDEAQAKNEDFLNKLDDNIKKIIKNQVKEQVKAQTSLAIAANLSELDLKKILIEKMKSNKSIHRSNEQNNLYKALIEAYESDKLILDTYGDIVSFKRRRDDEDKDEEPSAGSNWGSKTRGAGKEPKSTSTPKEKTSKSTGKSTEGSKSLRKSAGESTYAEEPMHTAKDLEEPAHQEFETGATEDQLVDETPQPSDWFQKPTRLPSPHRDWNNTLPTDHGPKSTRQPRINWIPEGQQYPHDLRKPLPLIPNSRGHQVIPFDHFINNDLAYLSGGVSSRTYATSIIKTKAADYSHIKWIEDLVPNTMWTEVPVNYDKHALWGISHWGRKRQKFYAFAANRESARDVYYKRRIITVTKLQIVEWHGYKHLDWITVRKDDDNLYTFKE
ncbi:hypothetical protein Tco_0708165 [Tanacetum coccineum]